MVRKMSLQEMQQFQEKHQVARADDVVGTDQLHTASARIHQGKAGDLLNRSGYQTSQLGYINEG